MLAVMHCKGTWVASKYKNSWTNLCFMEDSAVAVEELEGSDKLALHQGTGQYCRRRPPSCANGHFPEPCLEREATAIAHHLIHDNTDGCAVCRPSNSTLGTEGSHEGVW